MSGIAGVKSKAAEAAERKHQQRVAIARVQLAEIGRFLSLLRGSHQNKELMPLMSAVEAERNELVSSDEAYMQAAAGLWCQSDEPCVMGCEREQN